MSANCVALKHLNPLSLFSTGSDLCNLLRKLSPLLGRELGSCSFTKRKKELLPVDTEQPFGNLMQKKQQRKTVIL